MRPTLALWANDLKNTVRDRTVNILLLVPFILAAFLRFSIPAGERFVPAMGAFRPLIVGLFCMIAGIFPAFMQSFIMLDEKDENLFVVFRVVPFSSWRFLLARLVFVVGLSFIYPIIIILGSGLLSFPIPTVLLLSLLCSLISPVAVLVIVSFAKNKVEGLTILKGILLLLMVPLVGLVTQVPWKGLLGIIPSYWIYAAFAAADEAALLRASAVGSGISLLLLALSYRQFRRRVFP